MDKRVILFIGGLGALGILIFRDYLFMQIMCICILLAAIILFIPRNGSLNIEDSFNRFRKLYLQRNNGNLKLRGGNKERAFIRVQNAINNGKVFVSQEEDGIYIRLAGNENEGEAYSEHKVKVYTYEK